MELPSLDEADKNGVSFNLKSKLKEMFFDSY